MKKHLPEPFKRGQYYYFMTHRNGRRTTKSTGCTSKTEARKYIDQFMSGGVTPEYFDSTLRDYADRFFIWDECLHTQRLLSEGKSIGKRHVEQMRSMLERFVFTDTISSGRLRDVTRGAVLDFRSRIYSLTKTPANMDGHPNTANKAVRALKIVLSEAHYRGDIPVNPGAGVGPIKYDGKTRAALSVVQLREILDLSMSTKDRAFVSLLVGTGMRAGEVRALTWGKITDDFRTIEISAAFKEKRTDGEVGPCKWGGNRTVSAPRFLRDALRDWYRETKYPDSYVLRGQGGLPIGATWVKKHFDKLMGQWSNRPDYTVTPHYLRHSVNTQLLIAGVSPLSVAHCLGWAPALVSRTMADYTHLSVLDTGTVADVLQTALYPEVSQYTSSA